MSGFEKLARLLLSGAAADEEADEDELDDEALSGERGVAGADELLRSATRGANSRDDGMWLPLFKLGPRRKNSRASRADVARPLPPPMCLGDDTSAAATSAAAEGGGSSWSLCGEGLLASSSM